jgi:acetyl esterase/lipase
MSDLDRRSLLALSLAATMPTPALAKEWPEPTERIPLWPKGAPGLRNPALDDHVWERSTSPAIQDRSMDRIRTPQIHVFPAARPNGAGMLITPGGGYERVVLDKEGYELAAWLAARGITCFVLFYRLPAEGWDAPWDVPLADAQRAMRLIRSQAGRFGVDPKRIAALGFSAGGHLCASLATGHTRKAYAAVDEIDKLEARPMLAAPIYPVVSMDKAIAHKGSRDRLIGDASAAMEAAFSPDRNVTRETPPIFLLHAEDDDVVPVENSIRLRATCKAAGVPVEMHLFEEGGHGFGLRAIQGRPVEAWPDLLLGWLKRHGLLG